MTQGRNLVAAQEHTIELVSGDSTTSRIEITIAESWIEQTDDDAAHVFPWRVAIDGDVVGGGDLPVPLDEVNDNRFDVAVATLTDALSLEMVHYDHTGTVTGTSMFPAELVKACIEEGHADLIHCSADHYRHIASLPRSSKRVEVVPATQWAGCLVVSTAAHGLHHGRVPYALAVTRDGFTSMYRDQAFDLGRAESRKPTAAIDRALRLVLDARSSKEVSDTALREIGTRFRTELAHARARLETVAAPEATLFGIEPALTISQ